jgi:hypothetical protein
VNRVAIFQTTNRSRQLAFKKREIDQKGIARSKMAPQFMIPIQYTVQKIARSKVASQIMIPLQYSGKKEIRGPPQLAFLKRRKIGEGLRESNQLIVTDVRRQFVSKYSSRAVKHLFTIWSYATEERVVPSKYV